MSLPGLDYKLSSTFESHFRHWKKVRLRFYVCLACYVLMSANHKTPACPLRRLESLWRSQAASTEAHSANSELTSSGFGFFNLYYRDYVQYSVLIIWRIVLQNCTHSQNTL